MDIGVGLDARLGLPLAQLIELGREAADHGYDSAWTPAGGAPDSFHVCSGWATASGNRLTTGISVVPAARIWTVPALAMQAATVGETSGGRFILGIGTGGYGDAFWQSVKMPNRPVAVMRDYVTTLRRLLAGETVTHDGPAVKLSGVSIGKFPRVPVYLAALGPQMLRLAGECADGVCLNWCAPEQIAWSREQIAVGARKAGRDPAEIKVSMYIRVCIDEDEQAARRAFAQQVLGYAMARPGASNEQGYRAHFGRMGFEQALTDLEAHRAAGASESELLDAAPDDLLQKVGYYGRPAGAAEAFRSRAEGLDEAIVRVITTRPDVDRVRLAMQTLNPSTIRGVRTA
jgi:alkanesulfonate monooxygenase SsuD/methylene tetrahydromethanopterin reductase-like flavin-dependent oxidoreductase (luciferase family)